jgi:hypothetical protein
MEGGIEIVLANSRLKSWAGWSGISIVWFWLGELDLVGTNGMDGIVQEGRFVT